MLFSEFKKVLPYAVVVFLGYAGFAMPLPLFPEMLLGPDQTILPATYSDSMKTFFLGWLMSAYPLGQLIGSPILGKCSDRWGRKKVILASLLGCFLGYILTAFSVQSCSIFAIFLGLFFCGLCEGNIAIAQSVVADLTGGDSKKKTVYFGWLNLFVCIAFIVGPILGGQLSDPEIFSGFSFATPFWVASLLTLVGSAVVLFFAQETKKSLFLQEKTGYWSSFKQGLLQKGVSQMYLVNFFLGLGYFSYFRFLPVYLQNRFGFSSADLGYTMAYGSIAFAFAAFLFLKPIAAKMKPKQSVSLFSIALGLSFLLVLYPSAPWSIFLTAIPVNICLAIVMTYASVLVSEAAPTSFQGQALGTLTSVQVSAEILTGIGGGLLASYFVSLPIVIGSCMLAIAALILLAFRTEK